MLRIQISHLLQVSSGIMEGNRAITATKHVEGSLGLRRVQVYAFTFSDRGNQERSPYRSFSARR